MPNLTLSAFLQLSVLTNGGMDKKSQIPVQQNLASEEGDEKQYDNAPKLQALIFPLYLTHRIIIKEFFREIGEKTALFLPEIKSLIIKISNFLSFFENSRI